MIPLTWSQVAPGIWRAAVGSPEQLSPLLASGAQPRMEALRAMGHEPFPLDAGLIGAEVGPCRNVVCLPVEPDEGLFGLGLQFMRINHRGRQRYLRVNSDPKHDTGETHAPVPFYVSSRGYGVLANTARIPTIHCASAGRRQTRQPAVARDFTSDPSFTYTPTVDTVEIVVAGEGFELYIFAGPTMLDAVRRYNLFCGGGAMPPRWGLGFWHRVNYKYTADEVLQEALEYRRRGYPCDVIGLEPGWQTRSYPCSYEWAADRFPDPSGFLRRMLAEGFRVNLWEHGYVSPDAAIFPKLEPFSGSHTVFGGIVPDYTLPEACETLKRQHDEAHLSIGVSGYKLDECDGSELTDIQWMFPAHATFPSGHDGEQLRQVYGLLLQRLTAELFRARDRRTWGLVRASNAGASSLPYVLYSDLYDHRQFVRALCNCGFSGILWTPEIRTAATAQEWVRRMQTVCLSPLALLNAWNSAAMPWSFPEVEPIVRQTMQLRMRLMPYLYSAFARYHYDGTPPFRAMALETGQPLDIGDQWMVGDSLLVAPLFAGETAREVFLPEGAWYDFETGERFEGGGKVEVQALVEKLPLFVRDGGIIPLMPPSPHAPRPGETVPLKVRHYGAAPGVFGLFDDDGETLAYERGKYVWRRLRVAVSPDGTRRGSVSPVPDGWPSAYGEVTWQFLGGE
jgi:alpha-glucosidase (family GH31 glycosyl hydrolase)